MHHIIAKENLDAEEVTYRYFFWFFMYEAQENLSRTETHRYGLLFEQEVIYLIVIRSSKDNLHPGSNKCLLGQPSPGYTQRLGAEAYKAHNELWKRNHKRGEDLGREPDLEESRSRTLYSTDLDSVRDPSRRLCIHHLVDRFSS
jgi:hypothetical protein